MQKKLLATVSLILLLISENYAQPYADIVSANYQVFATNYVNNTPLRNRTDDFFLNFFLPKEFKNGNTLLIRLNSELINTTVWDASSPGYKSDNQLFSVSMPLGFKFVAGPEKKWESIVIGIPKIASSVRNTGGSGDFQFGGIFLEQYVHSKTFKLKAGLYYNREAFGNFFMPLVGLDWKVNDRIYLYGILPTNYKAEYSLIKDKLYAGINFKSLTRSFNLGKQGYLLSWYGGSYVRYNEMQLKIFLDYFFYKKFLVFGEIGYTLGESPVRYDYGTDRQDNYGYYSPTNRYLLFNVGFAYRFRFDLENTADPLPKQ
jgi:hypothetical protein